MSLEVVTTSFGKFQIDPAECIGATIKAGTVWDGPGFLQVIAREYGGFLEPGATILDVGAHMGDWAVWCARQGAWRVVVVEPPGPTCEMLKANLDLNKEVAADRILLIPVAAFDQRAALQWARDDYFPSDSGGAALVTTPQPKVIGPYVQAAALDEFAWTFGSRLALVKIDAQGCDGRVLRGLADTIQNGHPAIVFEWEAALAAQHGDTLPDTLGWLRTLGYETQEWPSHPNNFLAIWRGRKG